MTKFQKSRLILRQKLEGAAYYDALAAFNFAEPHHDGFRKDGVTAEFQHQIEIALFAMLLPDIRYREEVLATVALHDVREDSDITDGEIRALFDDPEKRDRIAKAVHAMTKTFRGVKRDEQELFDEMACDPIASIAKGCDRIHNLGSMVGVFTPEKQRRYIAEVRDLFLPMLKKAKRNFPYQTRAYELLKFHMQSQITLIEASLNAVEPQI